MYDKDVLMLQVGGKDSLMHVYLIFNKCHYNEYNDI